MHGIAITPNCGYYSPMFSFRQVDDLDCVKLLLEVSSLLLCCSKVDSNPPYSGNCFFMPTEHVALIVLIQK